MKNIVKFEETEIELITNNGEQVMTSVHIAKALGYASSRAVTDLYNDHKAEFDEGFSQVVESTTSGNYTKKVRVFNREGAWLIGMFARTPKAMAFRKWVLKVLGNVADNTPTETLVPVSAHMDDAFLKKVLTTYFSFDYTGLTDLLGGQTAPVRLGDFLISNPRGMRSPNILNKTRSPSTSVESPTCSFSGGITERLDKMKELISYTFNNLPIRTTLIDGNAWFVATDVAKALEYSNAEHATRHLDADEKDILNRGAPNRDTPLIIINESGLWSVVLRSRKAEAKAFKKFITSEVIPSIYRTGAYIPEQMVPVSAHMRRLPSGPREIKLSEKARSEIGGIVKNCCAVAIKEVLETSHISPTLPFDPVPYDADEFQIADWVNEATFLPEKIVEELKRIELASEKLAKKSLNPNITKLWRFFKALSALVIRYDTVRAETIFSAEMMRKNEKYSKDNMADEINRLNTVVRSSFITA